MKLELELFDRLGQKLEFGDIVKVSNNGRFAFYSEVKYLPAEQIIAPFHTFCFHSFEKVDSVPEGLTKGKEERYNIWYNYNPENDNNKQSGEGYLLSWRECERLLEQGCFRIKLID